MAAEVWTLDGLALNDLSSFVLRGVDAPTPRKRPEWIEGVDADGSALVSDPLFENRIITLRIRVMPQSTMDAALAKIGSIVDKLEEAERQPDGIALLWTPQGATKTLTFYVLTGEIDVPISLSGDDRGWFRKYPTVTIKLTCKPFGYGAEVTSSTVTNGNAYQTVELTGVTGDVPAEARIVVTDNASKDRRHVEAGLEYRYYNASTSLEIDSDSMTAISGAGNTRTGAYDPGAAGNSVIRITPTTERVQAIAATGDQAHIGTFRIKARVFWSATDPTDTCLVRLAWRVGDGPLRANDWAVTPITTGVGTSAGEFFELDLGLITVPPATLGTQKWTGQIECLKVDRLGGLGAGCTLDLDVLWLIPAGEWYAKARGAYSYRPAAIVANDSFTGIASATALGTRAAPLGGSWAGSGGGADFVAADAPVATDETEKRTELATTRTEILGTTSYTDVEVGVDVYNDSQGSGGECSCIARWTDASNHLAALLYFAPTGSTPSAGLLLHKVVGGTSIRLGADLFPIQPGTWYRIRIIVYASGRVIATVSSRNETVIARVENQHADLATGGTLATGKFGFRDASHSVASTRYFDTFYAAAPPNPDAIAIYSSRKLEFRSDLTLRTDSAGTYYGEPAFVRGGRLLIPPAGDESRKTRVFAKTRRGDIDVAQDDQIADSTKLEVFYTPRYSVIPR